MGKDIKAMSNLLVVDCKTVNQDINCHIKEYLFLKLVNIWWAGKNCMQITCGSWAVVWLGTVNLEGIS